MILRAYNPETNLLEVSYLTLPCEEAASSIAVENTNNFSNDDRILIGEMGQEKSEIVDVVGSVSSDTVLTVSSLAFPHSTSDPVYKLRFDQVKFYRSSTVNGTYTLIATVDLDVDNADNTTTYDDPTGNSSYFYKTSYYHSITTLESMLSDPFGSNDTRQTAGVLINEVMSEVGDEDGNFASREEYYSWINDCNDDLMTRRENPYDFFKKVVAMNTVQGQPIDYPTDLLKFNYIDYTYVPTNHIYQPKIADLEEWTRLNENLYTAAQDDHITHVFYDDDYSVVRTYPEFKTNNTENFVIHYYRTPTLVESDGDSLDCPVPLVYKSYLKAQFFNKRALKDAKWLTLADRRAADYEVQVRKLNRLQRKDGSRQSFRGERKRSIRRSIRGY